MLNRLCRVLLMMPLAMGALTACGDDDGGDGSAPSGPATSAGGTSAYPVTVEHALGSTTVDAKPERIVTLNVQWTDAVLAMGVEPVAYVLDRSIGETDPYPWQEGLLGGSQRIDTTGGVPYEQIAALKPDLILTTYLGTEPDDFEKLQAIAPTIGLLGDLQVDPWQDQVNVLGALLDDRERAAQVIAEVEAKIDELAKDFPNLAGKTYVAANYIEGDGIYVVADPDDGASRLFYALGMQIAPAVLELDEGAVGRVQISTEQVEVLDADFIGILTNGSDPRALPGWEKLRAVQTGALVDFELADVVGLNTPTPLSLPYVMELMRPALAKVA